MSLAIIFLFFLSFRGKVEVSVIDLVLLTCGGRGALVFLFIIPRIPFFPEGTAVGSSIVSEGFNDNSSPLMSSGLSYEGERDPGEDGKEFSVSLIGETGGDFADDSEVFGFGGEGGIGMDRRSGRGSVPPEKKVDRL